MGSFFGGPAGRGFRIIKTYNKLSELSGYDWASNKDNLILGDFVIINGGDYVGQLFEVVKKEKNLGFELKSDLLPRPGVTLGGFATPEDYNEYKKGPATGLVKEENLE